MAKRTSSGNSRSRSKNTLLTLPPGVKLIRTLRGHMDDIGRIAWSPDGRLLASPSEDRTIRLWDVETGACLRKLEGHQGAVYCVDFDPTGHSLVSGSSDATIKLWDVNSGQLLRTLTGHRNIVYSAIFDSTGQIVASGGMNETLKIWEVASGKLLSSANLAGDSFCLAWSPDGSALATSNRSWRTGVDGIKVPPMESNGNVHRQFRMAGHAHEDAVAVIWLPSGQMIATGSSDRTIRIWDSQTGRPTKVLEGHIDGIRTIATSSNGQILASLSPSSIRLWRTDDWSTVATVDRQSKNVREFSGLAFHPRLPYVAMVGPDPGSTNSNRDCVIHVCELDFAVLLGQEPPYQTTHYVNAKVVLLGDTGVGKSALSQALNGKPYEATDSTPGRRVSTFQSQEIELDNSHRQTRETLLWDLAGQPGYRVIHQLHLNEVAVALVVFDARSETDPLAGVRHWERALRLAEHRHAASPVPMKKFLVSARSDRGVVSVSKERLESLLKEFGFDRYFETSAKEGWKIKELRQAIEQAIPWSFLPEVSSSVFFSNIKNFLLKVKETGQMIAPASQLCDEFIRTHREVAALELNLRDQFETCVGRLENRDLIRRLSFGGYVLLQPELLDDYASAVVNAAKEEPDGLGSIVEDVVLSGQFYMPKEQKIKERGQEQLLLHAMVEELVRHDLALRESADGGRYLVFPSQFNRDYEDAPEPKGKALAVTFEGPVQNLYSTLAVRLGHSGLFTIARAEMWRNVAVFKALAGGKCGLYLHEFAEARGRLVIFYSQNEGQVPSEETRFNFEEFVLAHTRNRAVEGTVLPVRFFVCANCGNPVPDNYVRLLRERQQMTFNCPCGVKVLLAEPKERLGFDSKVELMEQSADHRRKFEMFVESARGETSTPSFTKWAGDERVTLAIVFTDIVGSTAMGENLKDERMSEVRGAHFEKSRALIAEYKGREIKTMGDSFMAAFRSVEKALDYAIALQASPGHVHVRIRAGVHIGPMRVEENDVFGGAVNFAARVVKAIKGPEIWLSDRAKEDLDRGGAQRHKVLEWSRHDDVLMQGFDGAFTLWSLAR